MRTLTRALGLTAAAVLAAATLAACSSAASPSPAGGIAVTGAWARASSATAAAGAAYMTITNSGSAADAVVGAASPAAATVEVHETYVMGSPAASGGMGMGSGAMGMRPIPRLEIPANGSVELKPGSYHIMLIGLTKDLVVGEKIEITLTFEKAGKVTVTAEVRAS
jgi:periplasmic copper chaperone A